MSGARIFIYALAWSVGTALWGLLHHDNPARIFGGIWDVSTFGLTIYLIARVEGRSSSPAGTNSEAQP